MSIFLSPITTALAVFAPVRAVPTVLPQFLFTKVYVFRHLYNSVAISADFSEEIEN